MSITLSCLLGTEKKIKGATLRTIFSQRELTEQSSALTHLLQSFTVVHNSVATCSPALTTTISCFHLPKVNFVVIAILRCSLFCGREEAVKCIDPDAADHLSQRQNNYLEGLYSHLSQLQSCTLLRLWLQNLFLQN